MHALLTECSLPSSSGRWIRGQTGSSFSPASSPVRQMPGIGHQQSPWARHKEKHCPP